MQIGEAKAKEILRAYDFTVQPGQLAATVDEAVEAGGQLGYPVAMKIVSPDIIHKSDIGGVKLNLNSPAEVPDAFDLMMLRISEQGARTPAFEGVYVERMVREGPRGHPGHDPRPAVRPHAHVRPGRHLRRGHEGRHVPPGAHHPGRGQADAGEHEVVHAAQGRARRGRRGPRRHRQSLQRISQLVTDFPQIAELDINPFIVGQPGRISVAADARITLKDARSTMNASRRCQSPQNDPNWQEKYREHDRHGRAKRSSGSAPASGSSSAPAAAQPQELVHALVARGRELADTSIVHLLTSGDAPYADQALADHFRVNSFFISANVRKIIQEGLGDYTPIFLSDIPRLFTSGQMPLDAALIQVTPPDSRGMCSLGISVDIVKSAAENASLVIAQVNPHMPRTLGNSFLYVYDLDVLVPDDAPLIEVQVPEPDAETRQIGEYIAALVEDGSTLEFGIGAIPQAVVPFLKDKKDLGIHTEMFTDAIIDLIESGAVTGSRKSLDRGKIVASFCMGTRRLYDYVDNNPLFAFHPTEYVNDPFVIAQQHKMVAINAALEIDLTGQVCADSLGTQFYSGIGGQVDFNRGAARSPGGKAIIALPSTAKDGTLSRIVTRLTPGAGVVTTRGDVHYVVTEYGVAYLHGKSVQERAIALISIAHPNFRAQLLKEAIEAKFLRPELADVEGKVVIGPKEFRTTHLLSDGTQINFRPIHPTDEPATRRPVLRAVAGDDVLPLHVPHQAHSAQGVPGLRLHRPPQGRRHRRDDPRGARRGHHRHRPLLPRREDQPGRGGVRRARRLAEPRHRLVPAEAPGHHRQAQRDRGVHRRGAARESRHAAASS